MFKWLLPAGLTIITAAAVVWVSGAAPPDFRPQRFDAQQLLDFTEALSRDELAGRATGSPGAAQARSMIKQRFVTAGLVAYELGYEHTFEHGPLDDPDAQKTAINIIGRLEGADVDGPVMVVSAHYDHLGEGGGEIFNGADDNASGVAAMIAVAEWFVENPPEHTIIFVAFDAEEEGLMGARTFVRNPPVPLDQIALNINLDMVARADKNELYVAGTFHTPLLTPMITEAATASPLSVLRGHDRPSDGDQDWTLLSDHGPFHQAGVPFLYFGVEDHADYHQVSDEFSRIDPDKFLRAVEAIVIAAELLDERLNEIAALPRVQKD